MSVPMDAARQTRYMALTLLGRMCVRLIMSRCRLSTPTERHPQEDEGLVRSGRMSRRPPKCAAATLRRTRRGQLRLRRSGPGFQVDVASFMAAFAKRCQHKIMEVAEQREQLLTRHKWDSRRDRQRVSCRTTAWRQKQHISCRSSRQQ